MELSHLRVTECLQQVLVVTTESKFAAHILKIDFKSRIKSVNQLIKNVLFFFALPTQTKHMLLSKRKQKPLPK